VKKNKVISFCIPIKNRIKDLKLTLKHNLDAISEYSDKVEIVVHCFDENDEVKAWIHEEFYSCIESGCLKFTQLSGMDVWHFSKAKNSFKNLISSDSYSSLDGDNYITKTEVKATLDIIDKYNAKCFIHHWSGSWGDGSSGRITVPRKTYETKGYLNNIFPRQFDEIGMLLACLLDSELTFITGGKKNFISESIGCTEFIKQSSFKTNINIEFLGERLFPENPRGNDYVAADMKIKLYQELNSLFTFYMLTLDQDLKEKYINKIKYVQEKYAHSDVIDECFIHILSGDNTIGKTSDKTVYAVIKNDTEMLDAWYEHYKKLGVNRFILVDDHSDIPLSVSLPYDDVFVYKPLVGDFKTAKIFWLSSLIKKFQLYDSWFLMIDSDELVDLSINQPSLESYCVELDKNKRYFQLGMLMEMLPEKLNTKITQKNFTTVMNNYYFRPVNDNYNYKYKDIPSIKWAFGDFWQMSFQLDFRFRYYNVIDSLRKFPLVKWRKGLWFNQGFHALRLDSKEIPKDIIFSTSDEYLHIRHYKMFKFLSADYDVVSYQKTFENYHARTTKNLVTLSQSKSNLHLKSWDYSPFKKVYIFEDENE
jgi:hypothetical protein